MKIKSFAFFTIFTISLAAQKIDNTASFRDIGESDYFRFHYDNDYFTATDYYYTQGYNFELVNPAFRKNPINYIFIKPENSTLKYGLSLEHVGYTPTSIKSDIILIGDRPFASAIMLKSFSIASDTAKHVRISSALSIGIIGPGAFGNEMQTQIHEWIGDDIPRGWQHQIRNDLLLNYELTHEKQLVNYNDLAVLSSLAKLKLGTVNTNAAAGLTAIFGKTNAVFNSNSNKLFQIYGYLQTIGSVIGYDASLQGGIFNRNSPYTIDDDAINRLTLQYNFGIVMQFKKMYLEYSRSELSKEFKTGDRHKWGGIRIGVRL